MGLTTVVLDPATGKLTATDVKPIDFSDMYGLRNAGIPAVSDVKEKKNK
jgi:hypothetical protein